MSFFVKMLFLWLILILSSVLGSVYLPKLLRNYMAKWNIFRIVFFIQIFLDDFSKVLPKYRYVIGKHYTLSVERDNSNIRNDVNHFTRCTKVVAKSKKMVSYFLKLWYNLRSSSLFSMIQCLLLTVFSKNF